MACRVEREALDAKVLGAAGTARTAKTPLELSLILRSPARGPEPLVGHPPSVDAGQPTRRRPRTVRAQCGMTVRTVAIGFSLLGHQLASPASSGRRITKLVSCRSPWVPVLSAGSVSRVTPVVSMVRTTVSMDPSVGTVTVPR